MRSPGPALACTALLMFGCTSPAPAPSAYDQWRMFLDAAAAGSAVALSARQGPQSLAAMDRLQRAYFLLHGSQLETSPQATLAEARAMLEGIGDQHELAPVRDGLQEQARLQQRLLDAQQELDALATQCEQTREQTREQLLALRLHQASVQDETALCREQLEALKKIENTIAEPVSRPEVVQP